MGYVVFIEVASGQKCPYGFTQTDSKSLAWWLAFGHAWKVTPPDHIGRIAKSLGVDTGPLKTVGSVGQDSLPHLLAQGGDDPEAQQRAREEWEYENALNQEAWHPPGDFVNTLSIFLAALQNAPGVYERLEINERYFAKDDFVYDLSDLLEAARWALEQGETSMRLVVI